MATARAASKPDRELDGLIAIWEGWTFEKMKGDAKPYWRQPRVSEYFWREHSGPPAYTASIDAAVALCERVLPEANCVGFDKTPKETTAYVSRNYCAAGDKPWLIEADGKTPALALCAAILRAKIAEAE